MYLFITISVYFFFFGITCTMTFQLIYWGTYTQIHLKINLSVYFHASLSSNHKDLPVTTTTCVHAHTCTRSWPYLFMFILSFQLTAKFYLSTFCCSTCTQMHLFISIPVQFIFFLFGITQLPFHSSDGVCTHRSTWKYTCLSSCFSFA